MLVVAGVVVEIVVEGELEVVVVVEIVVTVVVDVVVVVDTIFKSENIRRRHHTYDLSEEDTSLYCSICLLVCLLPPQTAKAELPLQSLLSTSPLPPCLNCMHLLSAFMFL